MTTPAHPHPRTVAIACQGGGSHTAFTAGVLAGLLEGGDSRWQPVAFSGTSGGAICALLAWYGLLRGDRAPVTAPLRAFWRDNTAATFGDALANAWLVWGVRWRRVVALPELSPYWLPAWGQAELRRLLERHVPFAELARLVAARGPTTPRLLVSAVDVLTGDFTIFTAEHGRVEVSAEAILASAAVPTLFRAVRIGDHLYWDGLFAQNPPVRDFLTGRSSARKPDEIWVIQVNPQARAQEPTSLAEIVDRRADLSANLSLNQEVHVIETVNEWIGRGYLPAEEFKPIRVCRIAMSPALSDRLDEASTLDRRPAFLAALLADGERQAARFLATWSPTTTGPPVP